MATVRGLAVLEVEGLRGGPRAGRAEGVGQCPSGCVCVCCVALTDSCRARRRAAATCAGLGAVGSVGAEAFGARAVVSASWPVLPFCARSLGRTVLWVVVCVVGVCGSLWALESSVSGWLAAVALVVRAGGGSWLAPACGCSRA